MKWIYGALAFLGVGIFLYRKSTFTIYEDEVIEIPHWAKTRGGEDYIKSWSFMTSDGRIYE
ncbi:MAG: hypothetical protein ACM3QX_18310 [Syntrophomonadaceae bacterium]